jgi:hypothetical protein
MFKLRSIKQLCFLSLLKHAEAHFLYDLNWGMFEFVKSIGALLTSFSQLRSPARGINKDSIGNTKEGSITVLLTSCLTGLDWSVLQIKTKIVSSHTADSKLVNQEVNSTVIRPPLVFPGFYYLARWS